MTIKPRTEIKVHDGSEFVSPSSSNSPTIRFFDIATGTFSTTRIGNRITLTSLSAVFDVSMDQTAVSNQIYHRLSIFVDRRTIDGVLPNADQVWEDEFDPISFRERDNTGRFRMLWSRSFWLDKRNRQRLMFRFNHTFRKGLNVRWSGTTGAAIQQNLVFIVVQADVPGADASGVTVEMRARYTDG